ncbi:MAG: DUF3253 domain-containing protein [Erythrobacter sp.]|jgi:hypothetical protein|nr:DUF3253 domain-containing protein [Erythrobacter sp.]
MAKQHKADTSDVGLAHPDVASAREAIHALLAKRGPGKTICPSEAARELAHTQGGQWRACMGPIHAAVDVLIRRGEITLSWRGERLLARAGAYRISRA